jgi:hypothetical protein
MICGYTVAEFRELLDSILPASSFRSGTLHQGKAVWIHADNIWTLHYAIKASAACNTVIKDERGLVEVALTREATVNLPAVLRAVGALS